MHITTVRSLKLDSWSDVQIKALELGGNKSFLKHVQLYSQQKDISCSHIQLSLNKYFIPEVLFYRYFYYFIVLPHAVVPN